MPHRRRKVLQGPRKRRSYLQRLLARIERDCEVLYDASVTPIKITGPVKVWGQQTIGEKSAEPSLVRSREEFEALYENGDPKAAHDAYEALAAGDTPVRVDVLKNCLLDSPADIHLKEVDMVGATQIVQQAVAAIDRLPGVGSEVFKVICDKSNNPQSAIDKNELHVDVEIQLPTQTVVEVARMVSDRSEGAVSVQMLMPMIAPYAPPRECEVCGRVTYTLGPCDTH